MPTDKYPDSNPKTAMGAEKVPMFNIPQRALVELGIRMGHGADKYGAYNWRSHPISVSVYVSAMMRHLAAFVDGEWIDGECPDKSSHLSAIMACCALLIDSDSLGILNDDRPMPNWGTLDQLKEYADERGKR